MEAMEINEKEMLQCIVGIVHKCGDIMLSATDIARKTHQKEGKGNFCTDYDSRIQASLKRELLQLLPEAIFYGEEDDADQADVSKGYAFIVDPIDGTTNFTRGLSFSCVSVALTKDGIARIGVVYNPYAKETFTAIKGQGAYLNGSPIQVSDRPLEQGLLLFGTAPYNVELSRKSFELAYQYFSQAADMRVTGSAALNLCTLACGRAEFFFEMLLSPWDYAAGGLLVEEAGGFVSRLDGTALTFDKKQSVMAGGTGVVV